MMIRPIRFTALLCWLMLAIPAHAQEPGCPSADRTTVALILGVPELAGILSVETAMCSGLQLDADRIGFRLNNTTLPVHGGIRSEIAVDFTIECCIICGANMVCMNPTICACGISVGSKRGIRYRNH